MTDFNAIMHQITALPHTLRRFQEPTSKGREGRGGERDGRGGDGRKGRGVGGRKGGDVRFSLSRSVNPKHNLCTCRMMLRCCPAMA